MYVSNESPEQVEARLRKVMANAELRVLPGDFAFIECPVSHFPNELVSQALALVRDDEVWSALVPSTSAAAERFMVFSFHFRPNEDNSGLLFVDFSGIEHWRA